MFIDFLQTTTSTFCFLVLYLFLVHKLTCHLFGNIYFFGLENWWAFPLFAFPWDIHTSTPIKKWKNESWSLRFLTKLLLSHLQQGVKLHCVLSKLCSSSLWVRDRQHTLLTCLLTRLVQCKCCLWPYLFGCVVLLFVEQDGSKEHHVNP